MKTLKHSHYFLVNGYKVSVRLIEDSTDWPERRYKVQVQGSNRHVSGNSKDALRAFEVILETKNARTY